MIDDETPMTLELLAALREGRTLDELAARVQGVAVEGCAVFFEGSPS